ncbi:MAG TPA: PaaI family thioesterase [Acidimicrobiales bacterium]|nr:PaaI family thioesterase [Acidimicrobiales bacterium]
MTIDWQDPDDLRHLAPGSPDWAARLGELGAIDPVGRRAELIRLAGAVRRVLHRLVQIDAPDEVIADAADAVEAVAARLGEHEQRSMYEGFAESANAGSSFGFFDHSPVLGRANPLAPPVELWLEGEELVGRATFGAAYEGPPGCVHGGFIAAAFDEVLGSAQSLSGKPGMTGRLTIHYRSPTPLHDEVRFTARLVSVRGRKILTKGELWAGDVLCAEGEGLFISIDFERFAEMKQEREARQADADR